MDPEARSTVEPGRAKPVEPWTEQEPPAEFQAPAGGNGIAPSSGELTAAGHAPDEMPARPAAAEAWSPAEAPKAQAPTPDPVIRSEDYVPAAAAAPAEPAGTTTYPYAPPEPVAEEHRPAETGPNWMLAFVCAWAGGTALNEAWAVLASAGFRIAPMLRNLGFVGYGLLGLGLFAFALEALRWGSQRRGAASLLAILLPALLTLAGVVCLILSGDPGRRI